MADNVLHEISFRIIWDGLGSFRPGDVPVLFPGFSAQSRPETRAIYTRVSTADQDPDLQLRDLEEYSGQTWNAHLKQNMRNGPPCQLAPSNL